MLKVFMQEILHISWKYVIIHLGDLYSKPVASPADGTTKAPLKHITSWGTPKTNSTAASKATASSGSVSKSASFETFQRMAKVKEEKV